VSFFFAHVAPTLLAATCFPCQERSAPGTLISIYCLLDPHLLCQTAQGRGEEEEREQDQDARQKPGALRRRAADSG